MSELTHRIVRPGFHLMVHEQVRLIPIGCVSTYGDIAKRLGSVKVARHVGWALSALTQANADVPWHRVINAQGQIKGSPDSLRRTLQIAALEDEGVKIDGNATINLQAYRWSAED